MERENLEYQNSRPPREESHPISRAASVGDDRPADPTQASDTAPTPVSEAAVESETHTADSKNQAAETPKRQQRRFERTSGTYTPNFIIELVGDPMDGNALQLLSWDGSKATIEPRLRFSWSFSDPEPHKLVITFDPIDLDASVRRAIWFPSRVDSFGSSRQLLDEICGVIKKYTNLPENLVSLAAHAALASWFPEAPDAPISLVIRGPQSQQARQLLLVLSCLYRRAISLGEIVPAALYSLPLDLSPSLFIERYDDTPRLEKLIRATFNRGYVPFKGKLVRTTCSTVFHIDEPLIDTIAGRNIIEIPTGYPRSPLPILSLKAQYEIAKKFQPKLLMYRLVHFRHVMNSTFDAASFAFPVNELARGLAACVVDDPERQRDIVKLLSGKNEHAEQELSWDPRVTVLEALFNLCHKSDMQSIYVGDVTSAANSILEHRGEMSQMTSRMVGSKLHVLGFTTTRLDSAGRGLQLKTEMRKRIHRVAWDYRVAFPGLDETQCDQCREILVQEEGGDGGRRVQDDLVPTP
jgi:hypothetical protein